ncbi:hypothetical protein DL764_000697 [Monosporascus ibericus]|uniref:DUF7580 domain-containing protein n=1 Tax=Monosporascus ibericus TaxID=155417 RepID=A0A4Q4TXK8_9PEZI|nr:hypothetical protein DL764_000697 [Monosporascus ibericus]
MSGMEVCGLILGIFPIAISALERHYNRAKEAGYGYRIRVDYQDTSSEQLAASIRYGQLRFVRTLKDLLVPLVDDAQLHYLLTEPAGDGWKSHALAQAVRDRLQESYNVYLETIAKYLETLQRLVKELVEEGDIQERISKNQQEPQQSDATPVTGRSLVLRNSVMNQMRRAKFSLGKGKRRALSEEIQTYNNRLEKLCATSDAISTRPIRKSRIRPNDVALCKFWRYADNLYRVLFQAFDCRCSYQHSARLQLQLRRGISTRDFRVDLSIESVNTATHEWSPHSITVKMERKPPRSSVPISVPGRKAVSFVDLGTLVPSASREVNSPKVEFQASHSKPSKAKVPLIPAGQREAGSNLAHFQARPIANLCEELQSYSDESKLLGYLPQNIDGDEDDIRYCIYLNSSTTPPFKAAEKTLSDILSRNISPPLSRRQRYYLALTITSSFIQLKDTPWFPGAPTKVWDKHSILFPTDAKDTNVLLLDRPFITCHFAPPPTPKTSFGTQDIVEINSLGILLLELRFNQTIESYPMRQQVPSLDKGKNARESAAFDLVTALTWQKSVDDEAGADYAAAVEWCLTGCQAILISTDGSQRDAPGGWRRDMLEQVLLPLERCFQFLGPAAVTGDVSTSIDEMRELRHTFPSIYDRASSDIYGSTRGNRTLASGSTRDSMDEYGSVPRSENITCTSLDEDADLCGKGGTPGITSSDATPQAREISSGATGLQNVALLQHEAMLRLQGHDSDKSGEQSRTHEWLGGVTFSAIIGTADEDDDIPENLSVEYEQKTVQQPDNLQSTPKHRREGNFNDEPQHKGAPNVAHLAISEGLGTQSIGLLQSAGLSERHHAPIPTEAHLVQVPEDLLTDMQLDTVHQSAQCWTCTPPDTLSTEIVPLSINSVPVVIPVESHYPPRAPLVPPPDPHPRFIDPAVAVSDATIAQIFAVYEEAIGFYLLINGHLQIIIPDDFDYEYALSHRPREFGGLNVSYIPQFVTQTVDTTSRASSDLQPTTQVMGTTRTPETTTSPSGLTLGLRPASLAHASSTGTGGLALGSIFRAIVQGTDTVDQFRGRFGVMTALNDRHYVTVSTHVLTAALLRAKSPSFPGDSWIKEVKIQIQSTNESRELGPVATTFDPKAQEYPMGFDHDKMAHPRTGHPINGPPIFEAIATTTLPYK